MAFTGMTMVFAAALVAQATLPSPTQALAVDKVIQHGPWTITISGNLTVDASTRTVTGTLTPWSPTRAGTSWRRLVPP